MSTPTGSALMERLVSLCKRRGFIFQSSEIYGGINGFWDYGPLGVELKNNLRDAWWDVMVHHPPAGAGRRAGAVGGLALATHTPPRGWAGRAPPMQACRQWKKLFRGDHVREVLDESEWVQAVLDLCDAGAVPNAYIPRRAELERWAKTKGKKLAPGLAIVRDPGIIAGISEAEHDVPTLLTIVSSPPASVSEVRLPCPLCGGDLTEPRQFNLMFETWVGAVRDEESKAYLRPETAQGMFINFKNV